VTSFAGDIVPLFSQQDLACMAGKGVMLSSYQYMSDPSGDGTFPDHANAGHILARLEGREVPQMPLRAPPWPAARIATFRSWIVGGFLP
jgi:hypothetical protein